MDFFWLISLLLVSISNFLDLLILFSDWDFFISSFNLFADWRHLELSWYFLSLCRIFALAKKMLIWSWMFLLFKKFLEKSLFIHKLLSLAYLSVDREKYALAQLGSSSIDLRIDNSASFKFPRSFNIPPRFRWANA